MSLKRYHSPQQAKDRYYGALSFPARCMFNALINLADDEGFFQADASYLQGECFPYDNFTIEKVKKLREEVQKVKEDRPMLLIFTLKNGQVVEEFGWLPQWFKHQAIPDYPKVSDIANLLIQKKIIKPNFNGGIHQKVRRMQDKRKLARSLHPTSIERYKRSRIEEKRSKGKTDFSSSSSQSQNQTHCEREKTHNTKYEPGPKFCFPGCGKPMADEGDNWFCVDCGIRKPKKEVK